MYIANFNTPNGEVYTSMIIIKIMLINYTYLFIVYVYT